MTDHSDIDYPGLLEEIPRLLRVKAFADALKDARYFSRLGEPLSGSERVLAQSYLDGLGFPDVEPAVLLSWTDAEDAAMALDVDAPAWEAEEMLRVGLTAQALETLEEDGVTALLTLVAERASGLAKAAIEDAAAIADMPDDHVMNAAVGGVVQAANGAALALMAFEDVAEAGAHPFAGRHQLYVSGRWIVGLTGSSLNIL